MGRPLTITRTDRSSGELRALSAKCRDGAQVRRLLARDRPEIRGIMTIGIGPVGYVAGWGLTDGMDVVFGWDGD
jgi:hypothetical protein